MPDVPPAAAAVYAPLTEAERAAAAPPASVAPAACGHEHAPGAEIETCC